MLNNPLLRIISTLFIFMSVSSAFGNLDEASQVWQTIQITNEQGLSNSAVNTIYKDSHGFVWFGTWDGLNRFDGKNLKTYYPDLFDRYTLSNNIIRKMFEDDFGNLWIVTENGINQYSYDMDHFLSWFNEFPELAIREESLKAIIGDEGSILVSAYGLGIFRFDHFENKFAELDIVGIEKNDIKRITNLFSYNSKLFILCEDSLITIDSKTFKKVESIHLSTLTQTHTISSSEGNWFFENNKKAYLGLSIRNGGLLIINLDNHEFNLLNSGNVDFRVTSVYASEISGIIWVGTDDGNIYTITSKDDFQPHSIIHKIPRLADKKVKIWCILETSDNILWIGTDGEGVFRSVLKPKPFFQIGRGEPDKRQLNHQIVRSIFEDAEGNLWVGTRGNGLNYIPYAKGKTQYFNTSNGLSHDAVLSLQIDQGKYLWIGHDGMGIDVFDVETREFFHFPKDLRGGEHLEFGSVYAICIDAFGQVWIGTSGYGVLGLKLTKNPSGFTLQDHIHIKGETPDDPLRSNVVYAIVEEKPNILWLGTRGAGVYRVNTLTGSVENYALATPTRPGLNNNDILSLHICSENYLWVGSSGGLNRININYTPYNFTHYNTDDGLPNNTIHSILEDREGNIWISTNKGLSQLLRDEDKFVNFNSADGLQSNEYTDGAAWYGKKTGRMYFGGINGLDWFYPENIKISQIAPTLILTGFRLYNKHILPSDSTDIIKKNLNEVSEITLKHNQNFFSVDFTTLNFINPDKSVFEYKLENFNTDWIYAGNQREANFTNVPHGKYILKIRATNEDGIWSSDIKTLIIIIKPPFWRTWPAYFSYFIILFSVLFGIYQYQSKRIRDKQQRSLEKVKEEKEKEINRYKLHLFTNLTHEFGTPLTLIFASAASLLNPKKKPTESNILTKTIYQNSRRMQRLVQELLEYRKIDTGREKLNESDVELISTLNNIVDVFSHFARENEVELSFQPEEDSLYCRLDTSKLDKIMLNLLSNAIKHTPTGGSVTISIKLVEQNIVIQVIDTGTGIEPEIIPYIFDSYYQHSSQTGSKTNPYKGIGIGLAYTKSLVELHGGSISVDSEPNKGSTFTVTIPFKQGKVKEITSKLTEHQATSGNLLESVAEEFLRLQNQNRLDQQNKPNLWTTPKKYKVLVAEDDQELANLLYRLLSEQYDVYLAQNGKQALDIIQNKRVDVVVSDIVMPEVDGLTLCKSLKNDLLTSHIPIILLTVRSEIENRIEGLEMGADSYIPKPFHPKHLFIRIEKLLKSRETASEYFKANFGTPTYILKKDYSSRDMELLEKCIAFVEANYSNEKIDADRMASDLALSKAQLYRKIKALTGFTPHGLIKNFRLKKAREMISEGKHNISEIIYMTGFNNRTYFYRSYKETFGDTPGEIVKS